MNAKVVGFTALGIALVLAVIGFVYVVMYESEPTSTNHWERMSDAQCLYDCQKDCRSVTCNRRCSDLCKHQK